MILVLNVGRMCVLAFQHLGLLASLNNKMLLRQESISNETWNNAESSAYR